MAGSVTPGNQPIPFYGSLAQAIYTIAGTGTNLDGTQAPGIVLVDANNPGRLVSPAGTDQTQPVAGNVASGVADSGNPVKIGGVYIASTPAPAAGQRIDMHVNPVGSLYAQTIGLRQPAIHHRTGVTAIDKVAQPNAPTLAGETLGGTLASGTSYFVGLAAINKYGATTPAITTATAPGGSNDSLRVTITVPSGLLSTDRFALFLSTAAAPLWVAELTVAQVQAGGYKVTAVGTVVSGGTAPANSVDVLVVGTGVATSAVPFAQNNAFLIPTPTNALSGIGWTGCHLMYQMTLTDLKVAPSLAMLMFMERNDNTGVWYQGNAAISTAPLSASRQTLMQDSVTFQNVNGALSCVVVVDAIGGDGASVDMWAEMY